MYDLIDTQTLLPALEVNTMEFGDQLKKYRADNKISQEELAAVLGTSKQVISRYENKQRYPRLSTALLYSDKLSISLLEGSADAWSTTQEFAKRLQQALDNNDMRPTDLAKKTGIGKSDISSYLSGRYKPKQDNVYTMAKALNVDEAWLMGWSDDPGPIMPGAMKLRASITQTLQEITQTIEGLQMQIDKLRAVFQETERRRQIWTD